MHVVKPTFKRTTRPIGEIPFGTPFQFGSRIQTFMRVDNGDIVCLETGLEHSFDGVLEDYVEYPDAKLILRP